MDNLEELTSCLPCLSDVNNMNNNVNNTSISNENEIESKNILKQEKNQKWIEFISNSNLILKTDENFIRIRDRPVNNSKSNSKFISSSISSSNSMTSDTLYIR